MFTKKPIYIVIAAVFSGVSAISSLHAAQRGHHEESLKHITLENAGFPLGYSVEKMKPGVAPGQDFNQFAAGHWFEQVKLPGDSARVSSMELLAKKVEIQLQAIMKESAKRSLKVAKGSNLQLVGDFFASGMNTKRLTELGVEPLTSLYEKVDAIDSPITLARELAELQMMTNDKPLIAFGPETDTKDRNRYLLYLFGVDLVMASRDNYLKKEAEPIRAAYLAYIEETLSLMGAPIEDAQARAKSILDIEKRIASKKLTPVEKMDPGKRFVRMSMNEVKALLSNIDIKTYLKTLGLPLQEEFIVVEKNSLSEINNILQEYPLDSVKDYIRWGLLVKNMAYLAPEFIEPYWKFSEVVVGKVDKPSRAKIVSGSVHKLLGHPLSQLYVDKHFTAQQKKDVEKLVENIKATFRKRLVSNDWLSEETKKTALEKVDKLVIEVGYPEKWKDQSLVDIRRDDYFGNAIRLNEYESRRELAKLGKSVIHDNFSHAGATMPIDINAAYSPGKNRIEIAAAFLQQPFYDSKADVAVNYCTIGAVIGHEITHGFDSQGRRYDPQGNIRDWWTKKDAENFVAEAEKLVKQANAYEALPGINLNGELTVGENLADVGGLTVAVEALREHLRAHPEANKKIDGFTPEQSCFVAWAQTWASKTTDGYLKQTIATDPHPPGNYRMVSPGQHVGEFYDVFDIKAGDPMWLDVSDRVKIW